MYLQPPRDGLLQVRATLIPTLQTTNDLANLSLSLPQVADTALQVLYDTVASPPEVMNYFGVVVNDTATRQVTAQLGPVKDLKVRWRLSLTPPVAPELRVEPRWWVHVGEQDISLEMEHDRPTNAGIARLIVDQSEPPICTNPAWQIQNAQIIEGGRRSIQLAPLSDSPGPIRLLWSLKARGTAQENIALPTVRAEDTPPPSRILLGIDAPPDWKVEPVGNAAEPLASDALALSWKGQPGAVTGVYRLDTSAAPTLSIVRSTPPERFYHERHRLHLSDAIEANLRYELRFTDEQAFEPLRFELPAQFSIDAVEVDGAPAFDSVVVQDTKRYLTLRLDPDLSAHRILIEGRAGRGNRFRPPKLRMIGLTAAESNYEVVYDPGVRVNRESPAVLEGLPLELTPEQQLSDLIVPLVRWQVPAKYLASTALPDWLQLERAVTNGADIVSVMRYNDGTWTNETQITLRGLNGNFVALEIPSDWSKGVRFEPTAPSVLLRPENGVRVVHVLPQIDSSGNAKFTLRSELATDVRRVEAPIIRIRGRGERNYHLVLPGRLTSKPQDWQRVAMRPSATSVQALGVKEPPPDPVILEPESIAKPFAAMPISDEQQGKDPASAALRESAYLRSPNHTSHVLTRWDLTPGDEREVIIDLPPHATCINVTSCGQNTNWSIVEPPADGSGRNDPQPRNATTAIRVPLNLSQLAQQFEVLISLDDQVPALPTLRDVPVERSVLRILSPLHLPSVPTQPSKVWEPVNSVAEIRHQAASSVLQASVDAIADRPRREIAAWLAPWLPRLIDANMRSTSSDTADDEQEGLPPEVANLLSNIDQQQISLDSANQQVSPTEDPRLWRVDQLLVADNQPVEVPEPEPFRSWSTTAPFRSTVFLWCAALLLVSFILGVLTYLLPELLRTSTTPLLLGGLLTTVLHPPTGCVLVAAAILITWYQRSTWLPQNGVQPSRP